MHMELQINSGFGCVAIRTYSTVQGGKRFTNTDKIERAKRFQARVNSLFNKWSKRTKYLMSFAPENWIKLPKAKQENHTHKEYIRKHKRVPGLTFQPGKILAQVASVLIEATKVPEQTTTVQILSELEFMY